MEENVSGCFFLNTVYIHIFAFNSLVSTVHTHTFNM